MCLCVAAARAWMGQVIIQNQKQSSNIGNLRKAPISINKDSHGAEQTVSTACRSNQQSPLTIRHHNRDVVVGDNVFRLHFCSFQNKVFGNPLAMRAGANNPARVAIELFSRWFSPNLLINRGLLWRQHIEQLHRKPNKTVFLPCFLLAVLGDVSVPVLPI